MNYLLVQFVHSVVCICKSVALQKKFGFKSEAGKINMFYGVTIGVSTAGSTHISHHCQLYSMDLPHHKITWLYST